jgi:hypothetical protein
MPEKVFEIHSTKEQQNWFSAPINRIDLGTKIKIDFRGNKRRSNKLKNLTLRCLQRNGRLSEFESDTESMAVAFEIFTQRLVVPSSLCPISSTKLGGDLGPILGVFQGMESLPDATAPDSAGGHSHRIR